MSEPVAISCVDGLMTLTLNVPERRNAIGDRARALLIENLNLADADPQVRAVLVRGAGADFSSGADLRDLAQASAPRMPPRVADHLTMTVARCRKPVVAAVQGWALGLGMSLALACDVRIVAPSTKLAAFQVKRGLMPDAGLTHLLASMVGVSRALRVLMLSELIDGARCDAWGIGTLVDESALQGEAAALAARLATGPTRALTMTKHAVRDAADDLLVRALANEGWGNDELFRSQDFREAMAAWREKREPRFTGS